MRNFVFILSLFFGSFSFVSASTFSVVPRIDPFQANNINFVSHRFCDGLDYTKLSLDMFASLKPYQYKDYCLAFANGSNKNISIIAGFGLGTLDNKGNIICDTNFTEKNDFSRQYIIADWKNIPFEIPASGSVVKNFRLDLLKNLTGDLYGCLSYRIATDDKMLPGEMFLVVVRKTASIKVSVLDGIYKWRWFDDLKDVYKVNKVKVWQTIAVIIGLILLWEILKLFGHKKQVVSKPVDKKVVVKKTVVKKDDKKVSAKKVVKKKK